ncbi:hypothetical protein AMIS_21370 [Actinoplanes missouriensis 431]|uniref:HNH endonuclease n=1 Tax=Actinoplanes missouriensis (strain ATCC 14538 / DSM 43046 / CBS 188.64 / JCM 3121 / NBRC 102363 / NCIMB 12654 / NRRL B-3342 / UNCC 431) TaxID=512565 RepID=I0H2X0_ACTM4|nr:hypothetical protein [Actinoplanes missouriensis]BAL87357.1 hypothetical protein AMIS_21370 [Actinoplanes missouriensis 431]
MKRTAIARRTPLRSGTPLARTSSLAPKHTRQTAKPKRQPPGVPARVRAALKQRSCGVCEIQAPGCDGRAVDPSHRITTGMGGRHGAAAARHHVLSNLLHACRGCHSGALHAMPAAAYWRGWMLHSHEDPTSVPVLYRGVWSLLTDAGDVTPTNQTTAEEA